MEIETTSCAYWDHLKEIIYWWSKKDQQIIKNEVFLGLGLWDGLLIG